MANTVEQVKSPVAGDCRMGNHERGEPRLRYSRGVWGRHRECALPSNPARSNDRLVKEQLIRAAFGSSDISRLPSCEHHMFGRQLIQPVSLIEQTSSGLHSCATTLPLYESHRQPKASLSHAPLHLLVELDVQLLRFSSPLQ